MNLKLKAARDVAGMVALAIGVSALVQFILYNVPLVVLGYVAGVAFFSFMLYILYSIRLGQLEYRETLTKMVDR